jgi:hypothetical protein
LDIRNPNYLPPLDIPNPNYLTPFVHISGL